MGLVLASALLASDAQVRITVAATKGEIIPQSRGGGGFQRTFRFTAKPGKALHSGSHWIRQTLEVRGTVFDAKGNTVRAHLDVIEYYRVDGKGRAIQADSHYSQFEKMAGGDLTIRSTLIYGTLTSIKRGDSIMGKSFILRSCADAAGKFVTMKTRKGRIIPAEKRERVTFKRHAGSLVTRYEYGVRWDARSRTKPSGTMEVGTWLIEVPQSKGTSKSKTSEAARPRAIPLLKTRRA